MTTQININSKSQLAKLIATENLTVEHNNVKTASFDTVNRILTLPIFKVQSGDVYDMLIAHECSHALFTPAEGWKSISDDKELRTYVNVLEDTRIDKLIQKKYPGVVYNYMNGFDILNKQDFFGLRNKNVNTDLMLIDKINIRSKSLNRINFNFNTEENEWLKKVDALKTFKQVVKLAKEMLDWQKKQLDELKKLPKFEDLEIVKQYGLSEDQNKEEEIKEENLEEGETTSKNDLNEENEIDQNNNEEKSSVANKGDTGGKGLLSAITDMSFEQNKKQLFDNEKSFAYYNMPDIDLNTCLITQQNFRKQFKEFMLYEFSNKSYSPDQHKRYYTWIKEEFKKFKNDNKKTVMYLVKEFEMKKAATSYKRATQDKTGVIDPLKLKNYKFSDDIFKRLTVLPNAKNHGMMMLLDWSGSMCDVIKQTVDQLCNLVWFCQKINIPFNVYFFKDNDNFKDMKHPFSQKNGDMAFDDFRLIEIANHKMKKIDLDESLLFMYSMASYYNARYTRTSIDYDMNHPSHYNFGTPKQFALGSTPLNEALVACSKLIPMVKNKYKIEKMTFITLTDGASNSCRGVNYNTENGMQLKSLGLGDPILRVKGKYIKQKRNGYYWYRREDVTANFLDYIRKHDVTIVGFYIIKRLRGYESEKYFSTSDKTSESRKKQFSKEKCTISVENGYDEFYLINGKNMSVENVDLSGVNGDMKAGKIKQIFSKSMKGRITSRLLLNKFVSKVA